MASSTSKLHFKKLKLKNKGLGASLDAIGQENETLVEMIALLESRLTEEKQEHEEVGYQIFDSSS